MPFARQMNLFGRIVDLSQVIDPEFVRRDPCLNCSLPFCNDRSKECAFLNTAFRANSKRDQERRDLLEELKEEGIIRGVFRNGVIDWADETNIERRRRINREWMAKHRKLCTTEG